MKNKFDITKVMRSKTMREFYKDKELSLQEKIAIIIKSYNSLTNKQNFLDELYYSLDTFDKNKDQIKQIIKLINIIQTLYYFPNDIFPNCRFFYKVSDTFFIRNITETSLQNSLDYYIRESYDYKSKEEFLYNINDLYKDDNMIKVELFVISDNNIFNPIDFYCSGTDHIEGPFAWKIVDEQYIDIDNKEELFYDYMNPNFHFKNSTDIFCTGDKIKIQVPSMKTPIYGYLYKDCIDPNYLFLYKSKQSAINNNGEDFIDLSLLTIDQRHLSQNAIYSIFDWVEKIE